MYEQLSLVDGMQFKAKNEEGVYTPSSFFALPTIIVPKHTHSLLSFDEYDIVIVNVSGGKDSLEMLRRVLKVWKIPKEKVWAWHQAIDGFSEPFYDWPITIAYVRALCQYFGVRLFFQWRAGGFKGELLKKDARSGDVLYCEDGCAPSTISTTERAKVSTRRRWPAKSRDLRTRWCTSTLKIDPARRVITRMFQNVEEAPINALVLTGERREESPARAKFDVIYQHPSTAKYRRVDAFHPILDLKEKHIWEGICDEEIHPHPAYYLGFPRVSCRGCIFYLPDHWATLKAMNPDVFAMYEAMERELEFTLDMKRTLYEVACQGTSSFSPEHMAKYLTMVNSEQWTWPIEMPSWLLPVGAFGSGGGAI